MNNRQKVEIGLERLTNDSLSLLAGKRVGLICNQASVDHDYRHAADILFTARRFGADEAKTLGLLNRVVPKVELEKSVIELASTIAENAPLTVQSLKVSVKEYMRDSDKRNREHCDNLVRACGKSEDFIEGARAFMGKRKPNFKGR